MPINRRVDNGNWLNSCLWGSQPSRHQITKHNHLWFEIFPLPSSSSFVCPVDRRTVFSRTMRSYFVYCLSPNKRVLKLNFYVYVSIRTREMSVNCGIFWQSTEHTHWHSTKTITKTNEHFHTIEWLLWRLLLRIVDAHFVSTYFEWYAMPVSDRQMMEKEKNWRLPNSQCNLDYVRRQIERQGGQRHAAKFWFHIF